MHCRAQRGTAALDRPSQMSTSSPHSPHWSSASESWSGCQKVSVDLGPQNQQERSLTKQRQHGSSWSLAPVSAAKANSQKPGLLLARTAGQKRTKATSS
ncbi:hypothetical protein DV515_00011231 [Chloebia gouldiae]|uniref:Uncharacterized protein n=1 Tax=Chloebia gouldiae TaxID=44316 RepID=A0A3L8S740_CHLGU|nr:hypothetical protein DV515_00011231 [Chloebia gouldiae]